MKIDRKITSQADSENLSRFFSDIRNFESLSKEEERELIKKFQNNNDQKALSELINANIKFVVSVAKKYQGGGVPILDLISEGNAGLIEAAHRFDVRKDIKFFSYAVWWIRIKIFTSFDYNNRTIQLPANREMLVSRVKKEINKLEQRLDRYPTIDELFTHFSLIDADEIKKLTEEDIREAILHASYLPSMQDTIKGSDGEEDEVTYEDVLKGENQTDSFDKPQSLLSDIDKFLYHLSQLEYDCLALSLGLNGETTVRNEDLSKLLKTKEAAKIKMRALKRLRKLKNIGTLREYL